MLLQLLTPSLKNWVWLVWIPNSQHINTTFLLISSVFFSLQQGRVYSIQSNTRQKNQMKRIEISLKQLIFAHSAWNMLTRCYVYLLSAYDDLNIQFSSQSAYTVAINEMQTISQPFRLSYKFNVRTQWNRKVAGKFPFRLSCVRIDNVVGIAAGALELFV